MEHVKTDFYKFFKVSIFRETNFFVGMPINLLLPVNTFPSNFPLMYQLHLKLCYTKSFPFWRIICCNVLSVKLGLESYNLHKDKIPFVWTQNRNNLTQNNLSELSLLFLYWYRKNTLHFGIGRIHILHFT